MPMLRRFQPTDAPAVVALHHLALERVGASLGPGPWDDDLVDIEAAYLASGGEFLVIVENDLIIAMGAYRRVDDDTVEIKRMRVLPDRQGQGLGRQMLTELHARAAAAGYLRFILDTTEQQTVAQRLYESVGYRHVRTSQIGPFSVRHYERNTPEPGDN